jgi:hypothetical protein
MVRLASGRGSRTRSRWCRRLRSACNLGDVWALVSRTDPDFEGFARLHNVDAALCQDAPVEESVAGSIGEFDEAKSLLRTEPFYDATDRRTGGWFEPNLTEPGSGTESTALRLVVVIVEFATPRMTKILISQFCFLGAWWRISSVARRGSPCARSDEVLDRYDFEVL